MTSLFPLLQSMLFQSSKKNKQRWLVIEDEGWDVIIPDFDDQPHGHIVDGETKCDLAWSDCPCKPRFLTSDKDGMYARPKIIHNSFRDMNAIILAMNKLPCCKAV